MTELEFDGDSKLEWSCEHHCSFLVAVTRSGLCIGPQTHSAYLAFLHTNDRSQSRFSIVTN